MDIRLQPYLLSLALTVIRLQLTLKRREESLMMLWHEWLLCYAIAILLRRVQFFLPKTYVKRK